MRALLLEVHLDLEVELHPVKSWRQDLESRTKPFTSLLYRTRTRVAVSVLVGLGEYLGRKLRNRGFALRPFVPLCLKCPDGGWAGL